MRAPLGASGEIDVVLAQAGEGTAGVSSPTASPTFAQPATSPGAGWAWAPVGSVVGSDMGAWVKRYSDGSNESWHPDLAHPEGKDPHWGWVGRYGRYRADLYEDGRLLYLW